MFGGAGQRISAPELLISMNRTHPWIIFAPLLIVGAATVEGFWLERRHGRYDWRAYFTSLGDMALRTAVYLLPLGLATTALNWLWNHRLYSLPLTSAWTWVALFFGQEFFYYWMHRADHRVRWLWATHSVHHSPNELNLAAAYRLGWTGRLSMAPLFFVPLVLAGFPPKIVGAALGLNLLYQFWLHAPWMPRLGPLEWVLNTPAHHRLHHASNPEYLDANFGGVLIIFDRLFGTFREQRADVPLRYGLAEPIKSYNPLLIGLREWMAIARDVVSSGSLRGALHSAFGPPPSKARYPRWRETLQSPRFDPSDRVLPCRARLIVRRLRKSQVSAVSSSN
jgi:sterol desaturase/sphingolipid hydroxylase (fatty acid hydroxylase superfamily)